MLPPQSVAHVVDAPSLHPSSLHACEPGGWRGVCCRHAVAGQGGAGHRGVGRAGRRDLPRVCGRGRGQHRGLPRRRGRRGADRRRGARGRPAGGGRPRRRRVRCGGGSGGGGATITMSSIHGVSGAHYAAPYEATKAAIIGFTRGAAFDLAEHGIRVRWGMVIDHRACSGSIGDSYSRRSLMAGRQVLRKESAGRA